MPLNNGEIELMAAKMAEILHRNWHLMYILMGSELNIKLSKSEAITVAHRALEMMEGRQI